MALKGNITITTDFYESWLFHPPWWPEEYPLEPIPPVDMKALCIGEIWLFWTSKEMETDQMTEEMNAMILVYVEVDEYFEMG